MAYVYTAQHTGTWFTIKFLEHFFGKAFDLAHLVRGGGPELIGPNFDGRLNPPKGRLLHSHFQLTPVLEDKVLKNYNSEIMRLIDEHKTVIPVRDPILSLLTRLRRLPETTQLHEVEWISHVDAFVELSSRPNVFLFPIDLYESTEDRIRLLQEMCDHVGVQDAKFVSKYAKAWSPQNVSNKRYKAEKLEYQKGNCGEIRKLFPESYDWLASNKPYKNFLKSLGYDLPWFIL